MKRTLIMVACTIIIIALGSFIIVNKHNNKANNPSSNSNNSNISKKDKNRPFSINVGSIDGENLIYKDVLVEDYAKYKEILEYYEMQDDLTKEDFIDYDYLAVVVENDYCNGEIDSISDARIENNNIEILVDIEASCAPCAPEYELYFVRFNKGSIKENYKVNITYENINKLDCDSEVSYKPIIYLYPKEEVKVNVTVGHPEYLTTTYPKYNNGWNVLAKPDGTLIDEYGRHYYALYWEGLNTALGGITEEGFVVSGQDSSTFLEEKLALLGLNEREANEFIMYWLPKLEANKYNYIRFATMKQIDTNMPLAISPKPDSIIRVMMLYKPLDSFMSVVEQQLEIPSIRHGFTVVEWGGTELH